MEELDATIIRKKSIQGVFALISRTFFLNIISFAASLVIYTVLTPKDVGVYVAVIAMQRIISFFTDFGLAAALIQKKGDLEDGDIKTSFTIQVLITGFIFIVVLLLYSSIKSFFSLNDSAMMLLIVLVFTVFLSSFKIIPSIILERKINFHKLIFPQVIEALVFNAILIVLVINKAGLASFTYAFLVSSIISIPFYYYVSPWKIQLGINKNSLKHLKFGIGFQAKNILATIKDDFLTVFLAKFLTYSQIGYIGFAQRNAFFPFRYVVDSVTKVSFSTYSRLQDDKILLKSAIEKSLFFVSFLMFPILLGMIVTMPYVVEYFPKWHNKWEPALLSLTFFCLNALISSFSNILVNVLDSTGRVKTTLKLMVVWTSLTWLLTPLLIAVYSYNGVAIASFLVTLSIFYTVFLVKKIVKFDFIKSIYKPGIAGIVMILVLVLIGNIMVKNFLSIPFMILCGGITYGIVIYLLAREQVKEGLKIVFVK